MKHIGTVYSFYNIVHIINIDLLFVFFCSQKMDFQDSDGDDIPLARRMKLDPDVLKNDHNSSGAKVIYIHILSV